HVEIFRALVAQMRAIGADVKLVARRVGARRAASDRRRAGVGRAWTAGTCGEEDRQDGGTGEYRSHLLHAPLVVRLRGARLIARLRACYRRRAFVKEGSCELRSACWADSDWRRRSPSDAEAALRARTAGSSRRPRLPRAACS